MRRRALKASCPTPFNLADLFVPVSSGVLVGGASWVLLIVLAARVA